MRTRDGGGGGGALTAGLFVVDAAGMDACGGAAEGGGPGVVTVMVAVVTGCAVARPSSLSPHPVANQESNNVTPVNKYAGRGRRGVTGVPRLLSPSPRVNARRFGAPGRADTQTSASRRQMVSASASSM
jgi:hypothetical protein